ncbi:hypothetical protein [Paenibacillus marinisediminis]
MTNQEQARAEVPPQNKQLNQAEESFVKWHDTYISNWQHAMLTGDTSGVEVMAPEYYVTFFMHGKDKPMFFSYEEAIEGMKQSVDQLKGAVKRFDNRIVRLKDDQHAIVYFEQIIEQGDKVLARMFTIENWELRDDKWLLIREVEEHI